MNNSISSCFVLTLMLFTIGYGIVSFPETGLLETVAQNPSDVNNPTNLSIDSKPHTVGMQTKDELGSTQSQSSTYTTNALPEVNAEETEVFEKQTSVKESTSEKERAENMSSQSENNSSVTLKPIVFPESETLADEVNGDISTPIPTNEPALVVTPESPEKSSSLIDDSPSTAEIEQPEPKSDTEVKPVADNKEVLTEEQNQDPFGMDDMIPKVESEPLEQAKMESKNEVLKTDQEETKNDDEHPIIQVGFEQPSKPVIGTIPRTTIPLDSEDESTTNNVHSPEKNVESSSEKSLTSEPISTSDSSKIDPVDSLPSLETSNSTDVNSAQSTQSQTSEQPATEEELEDHYGFQIPESGNIPVQRLPSTDQAVEPIYNKNMDRYALEK